MQYRFYLQLAEAYRQHTADAAELKPLGVELLMEVARKRALDPSPDDISRMRQLAQQLIAQGSQDPLVLQRQARLETLDGKHDAARTRLLACEDKLKASAYPPLARLLNSCCLCSLASAALDSELLAEHFPRFIEHWVNWAAEESKTAENRRYVVTTAYDLTTGLRKITQKNGMLEALNQREGLDGWVRNTIAGAVQMATRN